VKKIVCDRKTFSLPSEKLLKIFVCDRGLMEGFLWLVFTSNLNSQNYLAEGQILNL